MTAPDYDNDACGQSLSQFCLGLLTCYQTDYDADKNYYDGEKYDSKDKDGRHYLLELGFLSDGTMILPGKRKNNVRLRL